MTRTQALHSAAKAILKRLGPKFDGAPPLELLQRQNRPRTMADLDRLWWEQAERRSARGRAYDRWFGRASRESRGLVTVIPGSGAETR